ncbi:MAG: ComEC family competence protein [Rhodospirillales bacterium]|nr:ComEC family competence protein [Rhodospirillales bacterium]MBT4625090.1 ComEC family competence protein [Rhodospirillales bacterium]MBT5352975.1 ComEC family competence protein [Rhodospirillales bacterium]MBT5519730.1 ComEC family competence protein [Rhodospirillales bacterium]MBT6109017.1 ComEC family competence protein [Rhodospirillales bacterium]
MDDYHRWILWIPVFLGTGVGCYFGLTFEPAWYVGPSFLVTCGCMGWILRHNQVGILVVLAIAIIATGFSAAKFRTIDVAHTVLEKEIGPTRITGLVVATETRPAGLRIMMEDPEVRWLEPFDTPERIRININTNKGPKIVAGDWVQVYAVLRPPQTPATPRSFDFQRYAYFKEIGATGFSYGAAEVVHHTESLSAASTLDSVRARIGNRIRSVVPGTTGAVASALITGDRGAIPQTTVDAMRDAGLAHLLAISGLHIGLVGGFVFFCARAGLALIPALAVRYPIKAWAAIIALAAALGYTLISGATIPTLRAFTMMALVLGAVIIGRRGISMRLVAWAAMVILLFRPESLFGASFQLSFAAVIGLVAAYEYTGRRFNRMWHGSGFLRRMVLYTGGVGFSTIIASLSTAPFAAYHFHQLAGYGLLSNLLAVPLTALWIMPSALLGMSLMPFGLDGLGLIPMGWGIDAVVSIAERVGPMPGNVTLIPQIPFAALMLFVSGGLWLCLWWQGWRILGMVGIAAGLVVSINAQQPLIVAAANGELFSVRYADTMVFVGPKATGNRFTRKVWLEQAGLPVTATISAEIKDGLRCDEQGCILGAPDNSIAMVWHEAALMEDCWRAAIVLSAVPVRSRCSAPHLVIDRFDLWRNGAHAIYLDGTRIRMESTFQVRGTRPWTGKRQPDFGDAES